MRRIPINFKTSAGGAATVDVPRVFGEVIAVMFNLANGQANSDFVVSDHTHSVTILGKTGIADGDVFTPARGLVGSDGVIIDATGDGTYGRAVCMGTLRVAVANGGNAKRGTVTVLLNG